MTDLRVLQIAHDHPVFTPGGTELLAHGLSRALAAQPGVTSTFLAATTSLTRPEDQPGALGLLGEDFVLRTGRYDRFSMMRCDGTEWVSSLLRLLAEVRPHIVHLHGLDRIGAEVLPVIRRYAPQCRIVLTLHDFQLLCPNDGLMLTNTDGRRCASPSEDRCRSCFADQPAASHALRKVHLLALLRLVDVFLTPSGFLRDRFVSWGLDAERIVLLENAVTPIKLPPRQPRARPDRFAFFGNIARHKGVLTLLEAAARLAGQPDAGGLSIGLHGALLHPEPAFAAAFETALGRAAPVAQHHGGYDRADLPALLARTDWLVMPSLWWENAPLVLLEARAAGVPVICSGIGGMAEMVCNGVEGLHVPPGDAVALAATLAEVAGDTPLHRQLSGGQQRRQSPDAYKEFINEHLEIYRQQNRRLAA